MDLQKRLELNPMTTIDTALRILAHTSVITLGLEISENFSQAHDRYKKLIYQIIFSNDTITKEIYATEILPDGTTVTFKADNDHEIDTAVSNVNILQLLDHYNESLEKYGKWPIALSLPYTNGKSDGDSITVKDICEFADSIADAVTNIVSREDKLKVETFEQILAEATKKIIGNIFAEALPAIKLSFRKKFDPFITKGRVKVVTDKKIEAAIHLMGNYMDTKKIPERKTMVLNIGGFDLPKPDREHVVDIFINRIKNSSTT